jgi:hypothetical protein
MSGGGQDRLQRAVDEAIDRLDKQYLRALSVSGMMRQHKVGLGQRFSGALASWHDTTP